MKKDEKVAGSSVEYLNPSLSIHFVLLFSTEYLIFRQDAARITFFPIYAVALSVCYLYFSIMIRDPKNKSFFSIERNDLDLQCRFTYIMQCVCCVENREIKRKEKTIYYFHLK